MVVYKIKNRVTGEYARGGTHIGSRRWSRKGKIWSELRFVISHLSMVSLGYKILPSEYKDADIVEIGADERVVCSVFDKITEKRNEAMEKEIKIQERIIKRMEEEERRKYEELKAKYENK